MEYTTSAAKPGTGVAGDPFEAGGDLQDAGGDDGMWYIGRTRTPNSGYAWMGLIDSTI